MSPRIKVFLIYGVSFLGLFLLGRFIVVQFMEESMWTTILPIGVGMILAPKPYIENTQSGRSYGLKSIFSKKIFRFDD
jgi:hypothetical protein